MSIGNYDFANYKGIHIERKNKALEDMNYKRHSSDSVKTDSDADDLDV